MGVRSRLCTRLLLAATVLVLPTAAGSASGAPVEEGFELVGHDPLYARGMNAAPAVHGDHVYIGSRTDATPGHPHPGVLVVDVSDPASPEVVGEIGEANVGETSRELRVWPQQDLLIVLNFGCSSAIHRCTGGEAFGSSIEFYDIAAANAADPQLVSTYEPARVPHEFFLWVDPARPEERALLFMSTPTSSTVQPNLIVTDISRARDGEFTEYPWAAEFEAEGDEDRRLHSLGVSNDGTRAYLAFLGAGFLVMDTSEVAAGVAQPEIRLVTPPENRVKWGNPGAHSAVKLFGRDFALITDEVYGDLLDPISGDDHGCPWGWVRMIDILDPTRPEVVGEYRVEQTHEEYCDTPEGSNPANTVSTSYSAHNPTLTPDLAFITWHSAGLQAISLDDPTAPRQVGQFLPDPLPQVATEDPALSSGNQKVVAWSYPIIADGLIYIVDIRNGLYILRYTGEGAADVAAIGFLEGNSNLGDALRFEPVTEPDGGGTGTTGTVASPSPTADGSPTSAPSDVPPTSTPPAGDTDTPPTGGGVAVAAILVLAAFSALGPRLGRRR